MASVSSGRIWGKVVGGFLGFALGGPLGSILGFILGHLHDSRREDGASPWARASSFAENLQQSAFTTGVIMLGAKMAKADGRVTREEIAAFKRVFNIRPDQEAAVGRMFDEARKHAEDFEPYAFQLASVFRHNPALLEEVLSGLFIIAASDSAGLRPAEISFLKRVAVIFGFGMDDFVRIAARSGVRLPESERASSSSSSPRSSPYVDEDHNVLGIKPSFTNDEIKAAYRALIREHHPDKLVAEGMAPEFVVMATEKMKRINAAYDRVSKARGIK